MQRNEVGDNLNKWRTAVKVIAVRIWWDRSQCLKHADLAGHRRQRWILLGFLRISIGIENDPRCTMTRKRIVFRWGEGQEGTMAQHLANRICMTFFIVPV